MNTCVTVKREKEIDLPLESDVDREPSLSSGAFGSGCRVSTRTLSERGVRFRRR